jgi:hypothetical protein
MRSRSVLALGAASLLALGATTFACGDDSVYATDGGSGGNDASSMMDGTVSSPIDASGGGATDAGTSDAGVDRGPTTLHLPAPMLASPSGLFWQYGAAPALYIADDGTNQIVRWDDKKGFSTQVALPDPPLDGGGLGGLVRLTDGTFFVTRFGFGVGGGIEYVAATGDAGDIPGLDVTRKRIGLTLLPDGTLATTYFKGDGANAVGAVAKLTAFTGGEKDFITGLVKPVGVQYNELRVFTTDQLQGYVVQSTSLTTGGTFNHPQDGGPDAGGFDAGDAGGQPNAFVDLANGDALCQGPDGTLFAATSDGSVYQIFRDGTKKSVVSGLTRPRGVTYDGSNKRLFVSDVDAVGGSSIRIYPIN